MTKPLKNKIFKLIEKINTFLLFSKRYQVRKFMNGMNRYFAWENIKFICTQLKVIVDKVEDKELLTISNILINTFEPYKTLKIFYELEESVIWNMYDKVFDIKDILERLVS